MEGSAANFYYRGWNADARQSRAKGDTALSELLEKRDTLASSEDVLAVLTIIRDTPSKEFIPQLKDLWKRHQKNTFRVLFPKDWRYVKAKDYSTECL